MLAVEENHKGVAAILLNAGADTSLRDRRGRAALDFILPDEAVPDSGSMLDVFEKNDTQKFKKSCGTNNKCLQNKWNDLLAEALNRGFLEDCIRHYLTLGADINMHFGKYGDTPLTFAAARERENGFLIKLVMENKADIEATDDRGNFGRCLSLAGADELT